MFYDKQPKQHQDEYKQMLAVIGELSKLFSESDCPYLSYRAHENIFCKYLKAENLARSDCSADAKKGLVGIGLKTWTGRNDQKVAEFGRLKSKYANLSGIELVKRISEYRNERIRVTSNLHGIKDMIYHIVKRIPSAMQILECSFDKIDIENIEIIKNKGNENNTYFSDGRHTYHFSVSKNTLSMIFDNLDLLDTVDIHIADDPYSALLKLSSHEGILDMGFDVVELSPSSDPEIKPKPSPKKRQLCLPLYSTKGEYKFVAEKSGLNQWNASGRTRDANEIYIPYRAIDRNRDPHFFPARDTAFMLHLPDGSQISAKVCQEADKSNPLIGKSIMSNPNKVLGKWLLRDVFELKDREIVTYEMLEKFGIDSVVFTKNEDGDYSIEFSELGTYEMFYDNNYDYHIV